MADAVDVEESPLEELPSRKGRHGGGCRGVVTVVAVHCRRQHIGRKSSASHGMPKGTHGGVDYISIDKTTRRSL